MAENFFNTTRAWHSFVKDCYRQSGMKFGDNEHPLFILTNAAENRGHGFSDHMLESSVKAIPDLIHAGKIKPEIASSLIVGHWPEYIGLFRQALNDKIEHTKKGVTGRVSTTISLNSTLKMLDQHIKEVRAINSAGFVISMVSYLNHSDFFENIEDKHKTKSTGAKPTTYDKQDPLYAEPVIEGGVAKGIKITGGDTQHHSLQAVYRIIKDMRDKGVIKEDIGLTEDEFLAKFHMTPSSIGLNGARQMADLVMKKHAEITGKPLKKLNLSKVAVDPDDSPDQKIDKIMALATALDITHSSLTRRNLKKISSQAADADEDMYGIFKDLAYFQNDAASDSYSAGKAWIDELHDALLHEYQKKGKYSQDDLVGADGGIKGSSRVVSVNRDDLFTLFIPLSSIGRGVTSDILKHDIASQRIG